MKYVLYLWAINWSNAVSSDWFGDDDGESSWPSWYRLRTSNFIDAIKSINVSK